MKRFKVTVREIEVFEVVIDSMSEELATDEVIELLITNDKYDNYHTFTDTEIEVVEFHNGE